VAEVVLVGPAAAATLAAKAHPLGSRVAPRRRRRTRSLSWARTPRMSVAAGPRRAAAAAAVAAVAAEEAAELRAIPAATAPWVQSLPRRRRVGRRRRRTWASHRLPPRLAPAAAAALAVELKQQQQQLRHRGPLLAWRTPRTRRPAARGCGTCLSQSAEIHCRTWTQQAATSRTRSIRFRTPTGRMAQTGPTADRMLPPGKAIRRKP